MVNVPIDILNYILLNLNNVALIPKARVCKRWHEIIRRILNERGSIEERIAATLHNKRFSSYNLKIDPLPRKPIGKRGNYLYVAYSDARVYRFNLENKIPDRFYLIPHDWKSLHLKGNFIIAKTSPLQHHFIHLPTEKTHREVGKRYTAWNDWIIFLHFDLGLFNFFEKAPYVLHHNVRLKNPFLKIIDDRLYTYTKNKIWCWDLKSRCLLYHRKFEGVLSILKWQGKTSIRYLSRDLQGRRMVVYQALEEDHIEKVYINNAYRLLNTTQSICFAVDPNLGILVGKDLYLRTSCEIPFNERIYRFGPYILFSNAKIYKQSKGRLILHEDNKGLFVLDGTLIILKKKSIVIREIAKEIIYPLNNSQRTA